MTEILRLLIELSGLGAQLSWASFLVFLRVGAVMAVLPAFGEQSVPQRVRLVLTLAFTAVVTPAVAHDITASADGLALPMAVEVVAGLAIGIALRLLVMALQMAGTIAAQATSLSQVFGGMTPDPQPAIGHVLMVSGLALAVWSGLHVRVAELLILSYAILPPGQLPLAGDLAQWGQHQVIKAFALAFTLAAPFVIASVIYNLALGVINRAMPQLMVSFVGAPALSLGGLALFALVAPLALGVWVQALGEFLDTPFLVAP